MMARRARQNYLDPAKFRDAILEAQSKGEPTVEVCKMFRLLIARYLSGPRYSGYDAATIEDLASAALIKCIKNLGNYKQDRGSPFTYFSLACECSCKDHLGKFYGHKNLIRELGGLSKTEWEGSMPVAAPMPLKKNTPPYPLARETETSTPPCEVTHD